MNNANNPKEIMFPITVFFEDGSSGHYDDVEDLVLNLEDFDTDKSPDCSVRDAVGRILRLKLHLQRLETLELYDG